MECTQRFCDCLTESGETERLLSGKSESLRNFIGDLPNACESLEVNADGMHSEVHECMPEKLRLRDFI
jgi:hypothetical protein